MRCRILANSSLQTDRSLGTSAECRHAVVFSLRCAKQDSLRGCPALVQLGGFRGGGLFVQVGEYLFDDHWVFDAGDDLHRPAAMATRFDVDVEDTLQALRPGMAACPAAAVLSASSAVSPVRRPGITCARRWLFGAKTPWNLVRFTRGLGTRAARRTMTCMDAH